MKISSISQTPDQITLSWAESAETVRIFKDGQEVYSGLDASFTDTGLTPGTLYSYVLQGEETLKVQTATAVERTEKNENIPLQELIMTTVISAAEIAMAWEPIRGVSEYDVYRNGEYAGKVTTEGFHDKNLDPETSYLYEIKGIRPLEPGSEEASEKSSPLAKVIDWMTPKNDEDNMLVETFYIDKEIGRIADHLQVKKPARAFHYRMRYTTFLADEWVENPNVLSSMRYFTGDGRDFDPDGSSYRTRADLAIAGSDVSLVRDVGFSEGYSADKQLVKRDRASEEGIEIKELHKDEEKLSFMLMHSVGNPLVAAPDIIYAAYMTFYPNGVFDISGEHDEAPHHEVYLKQEGEGWKPLHRSESRGLERLAPQTANRFWRYSNIT